MTDSQAHEVEYPSRSLLKHARAGELFQSLEREVDRWNDEHQLSAPTRSPFDGEQRLEFFRPQILEQIPLDSWESTFHDGVHNLRVALDTLCYELCHLEGTPTEPGKIHFPITKHANEWPDRTKYLDTIPAELLERVCQCQPWQRPDPQEPDPLKLISRIDNVDKHRATGVVFDVLPMGQWEIRPPTPLPDELADSSEWPLTPWMTMTLDPPLERGFAALMPVAAVPFVSFEGLCASAPKAQRWLHSEVMRIISFIASGEWQEVGPDRVSPESIWIQTSKL